jgi:hypothetical protein
MRNDRRHNRWENLGEIRSDEGNGANVHGDFAEKTGGVESCDSTTGSCLIINIKS